jgi:hypothetical protein
MDGNQGEMLPKADGSKSAACCSPLGSHGTATRGLPKSVAYQTIIPRMSRGLWFAVQPIGQYTCGARTIGVKPGVDLDADAESDQQTGPNDSRYRNSAANMATAHQSPMLRGFRFSSISQLYAAGQVEGSGMGAIRAIFNCEYRPIPPDPARQPIPSRPGAGTSAWSKCWSAQKSPGILDSLLPGRPSSHFCAGRGTAPDPAGVRPRP